jgi:hypothetical protein
MVMVGFIGVAVAEVLIGLYIYIIYDPKREIGPIFLRKLFRLDHPPIKNFTVVRRSNRKVLKFCIISACVVMLNGVLTNYYQIMDLKEVILIFTVLAVFGLRYYWILKGNNAIDK